MNFNFKKSQYFFLILFGVAALLFFGVFYNNHLRYIEAMQNFLFTTNYLTDTIFHPGGVVEYISRFLMQFFHFPLLGALIIATTLVWLVFSLQKLGLKSLAYIPALYYWILLCSDSYTFVGLLALCIAVSLCSIFYKIKNRAFFHTLLLLLLPTLSWYLIGGATCVTILVLLIREVLQREKGFILRICSLVVGTAAIIFFAQSFAPWYNPKDLFFGAIYYRYAEVPLKHFIILYSVTIAIVAILPLLIKKEGAFLHYSLLAAIIGVGSWQIVVHYDKETEDNLYYLFQTREGNWKEIIAHAKKNKPTSLLSLNMTNLALAKENLSGETLFSFPQVGKEILVLSEDMDLLFTGEVLFNLGYINEAGRYAFEDMVSTPDRQKGAYFLWRLAQTHLIAGRERVAEKYLRILKKNIFYRKNAQQLLELIEEQGIDNDPFYGPLRRMQPEEDYYFNTNNFQTALEKSFSENPLNKFIHNYLMMNYMLKKDIPAFCKLFTTFDSSTIPAHYQEVLLLACKMGGTDPSALSYKLSTKRFSNLETFIQKYQAKDFDYLEKHFGNTFWYYLYMK